MSLRWLRLHHRTRLSISHGVHFSANTKGCHTPCNVAVFYGSAQKCDGVDVNECESRRSLNHSVKINRRLWVIVTVVKTKGCSRTSVITCLDTAPDTHAQLLMHEWFMFCHGSSSMKKPSDYVIHRWRKIWGEDLKEPLPTGLNESYFVLQKVAWPLMRKSKNKHNVENLESSKLSAAAEDLPGVMNGERKEKEQ